MSDESILTAPYSSLTTNSAMQLIQTINEVREILREVRRHPHTIALIPTMGALHAGHLSLLSTAQARGDYSVVSIFVNPTQFGPQEDFVAYPRTLQTDAAAAREAGAEVVFAPPLEEMYPDGFSTTIHVSGVT
jgi:pantoate--beta-alanine ligase